MRARAIIGPRRLVVCVGVILLFASLVAVAAGRTAGGAGDDRLLGTARAEVLRGFAGDDLLVGRRGRDRLFAGPGADRLRGGGGRDVLLGGAGRDRLDGGPGADLLAGGPGADVIVARDGTRDRIFCGPGRDRVVADRRDRIAPGCERVTRRPTSGRDTPGRAQRAPSTPGGAPGATFTPGARAAFDLRIGHQIDVFTTVCAVITGPAGARVAVTFDDGRPPVRGEGDIREGRDLLIALELDDLGPGAPFVGPVRIVAALVGEPATTVTRVHTVTGARGGADCGLSAAGEDGEDDEDPDAIDDPDV
jgi:Ca2+-binding RTX toxin-like protein